MGSSKIGVIIPAFNEASVIHDVVKNIPRTITHKKKIYTVIPVVVDDGSRDKTNSLASKVKHAIVIGHIINSGAGAATRTGLRYLRDNNFEYGATMDADGQHSVDDLKRVLKAALDKKADLVIGSRLVNSEGMSWYKVLGNKGLNFFTRVLLGVSSTDSQSGLKSFNKKTIEALNYRENGYAFCSEMLWRAKKAELTIDEVAIQAIYTDYSKAKGQSNWNAFQIIKQLTKHRMADLLHE